jgi:hypothetical protein
VIVGRTSSITSSARALRALIENLKDDYFLKKIPYRRIIQ